MLFMSLLLSDATKLCQAALQNKKMHQAKQTPVFLPANHQKKTPTYKTSKPTNKKQQTPKQHIQTIMTTVYYCQPTTGKSTSERANKPFSQPTNKTKITSESTNQ
ncbi:hypothetical protein ILYODFUR_029535 [Ilyodon furcidens]|uniref:Secreted protein n=1 Tax=Ilyodon furcidens TaxID=33524 RepID=A0ABV0SQ86_9TELE